jgi:hypothetical protein
VNVQATGWQADLEDDGDDVVAELGPFGRFAGMRCRRLVVHVEDDAVAELGLVGGFARMRGCSKKWLSRKSRVFTG